MTPELGHFALILALVTAFFQGTLPILGAWRNVPNWIAFAKPAAMTQLLFMAIAYLCLTQAFIFNDFSVSYVAQNSNTALPLLYKISGVWGGHEGSLLLWALVLSIWTAAVSIFSGSVPDRMLARVLGVMGLVSVGFLTFMLFTSNPFERLYPIPEQGRDLNPLLQDPGLAIHPPMLYLGYVGFSVAFAFAIAAMIEGRLDSAWARWSRPWTNVAWMFLTFGIALGSWWAYYELGWGGWWFWDPVENASFMPWLVGTALIHSLAVTEKRGAFKSWTVLLAVFAFSLSLLGTFLVRSGVLTSVHAFATDPTRGLVILVFLGVVVGSSLILYAIRAPQIRSTATFSGFSKETALLINNLLLVTAAASILLGTLYPLVIDALGMGKLSVGPPYFNSVFIPLTAPLALLIGFGVIAKWKKDSVAALFQQRQLLFPVCVVIGFLLPLFFDSYHFGAGVGLALAVWTVASSIESLLERAFAHSVSVRALKRVPAGYWGMTLAHIGVAVFVVGITLTSSYSTERDVRMEPGKSEELGGYHFRFDGVTPYQGPNYNADRGFVTVFKDDKKIAELSPQKRVYLVQRMPMTEAAIDAGLTRDLFVALGEPLGDGAWSIRLYHKPFIRWIWLGAMLMGLGGMWAATDRRYRLAMRSRGKSQARVKVMEGEPA